MQDASGQPGADTGRTAVRRHLLARLDQAGLVRAKGVTAEAHDAALARLVDHLAYMTPDNLQTLAEVVMDHAGGPGRNQWPAEVVVRNMAHALQLPPIEQHRIVTSWLASIEGPNAEMGGTLVELYRFLVQHRRPPMAMDQRQIREQAAANQREHQLLRQRIERGAEQPTDRAWLAAYERDLRLARDIVANGQARRAGGSDEAGAAA